MDAEIPLDPSASEITSAVFTTALTSVVEAITAAAETVSTAASETIAAVATTTAAAVATTTAAAVAESATSLTTPPTTSASRSLGLFLWLPSRLFSLVTFATITIPTVVFRILTWSFTLHLNFTSLLIILGIISTGTYILVRYRFLTKYSRLTPTEAPKPTTNFDLHPDPAGESEYTKPEFKNYPDEFLSAFLSSIKIFGYLEKPVFHELARHLQTKKLLAGDTLFRNPEQERSFYVVVDGHVQVFVKPSGPHSGDEYLTSDFDEDEDQDEFSRYQLLNEVSTGGTLSSLFTILSLFTEDVRLRDDDDRHGQHTRPARGNSGTYVDPATPGNGTVIVDGAPLSREASQEEWATVFPHLEHSDNEATIEGTRRRHNIRKSPLATRPHTTGDEYSDDEGEEPIPERREYPDDSRRTRPQLHSSASTGRQRRTSTGSRYSQATYATHQYHPMSVHPNIVARATVDTTLAVIPAEAFHRLTEKFPKSAAHIVQVILTRFQRVTFLTGHRYLGLTKELLRIEKNVNESASASSGLPANFFKPGGMERLRKKFVGGGKKYVSGTTKGAESDNDRDKDEFGDSGRASGTNTRYITRTSNRSSLWLDRLGGTEAIPSPRHTPVPIEIPSVFSPTSPGYSQHPLSTSPPAAIAMLSSPPPNKSHFRRGSGSGIPQPEYDEEDDRHLRASVMECLSRSIGLPASPSSPQQRQQQQEEEQGQGQQPSYFGTVRPAPTLSPSTSTKPPSPTNTPSRYNPSNLDLFSHASSSFLSSGYDDYDSASVASHNSGTNSPTHSITNTSADPNGNDVQILFFPKGSILVKEGERNAGLFFVIDGVLDVSMIPTQGEDLSLGSAVAKAEQDEENNRKHRRTQSKKDVREGMNGRRRQDSGGERGERKSVKPLFLIKSGGMAGYLAALSGYPSFVNIKAATDTYVGYLSKQSLDRIIEKNPMVMLTLAKRMIGLLSPLILHIDFALEWVQVTAGQILYREGDRSDSIYIVLNGRLRTISERSGGIEILGEYGQGESVGELDVLTDTPRPSTLHAIRDSELARMPKTLFNALALRHPEITMQISRIIALRSRQMINTPGSSGQTISSSAHTTFPELYGRNNVNLKTVGILPVTAGVPVSEFAERLRAALETSVGASTVLLNSATVTAVTGKHAFSRMGKLKLTNWLAELEERAKIVLYLADSGATSQWTKTCIRQADCILLVGLGDEDPSVGEFERLIISMKTTARKELVLLHAEKSCTPGTTQAWLKNRLWIQAHHHIFMPMRRPNMASSRSPQFLRAQGRKNTVGSINTLNSIKGQLEKYYPSIRVPTFGGLLSRKSGGPSGLQTAASNDFARLARRLCGKSVALVLGGGGARGIGHIGIIRSMEEAGIPIDIIGGTSIGSFVGGLYARDGDPVAMFGRAKMFSGRMTSVWRQVFDLTYPITAWFTGHEFNRGIWKCFMDSQIEDFWLPYFAVTTNITFSRMEVHTKGYAWRYVRASMSLSGYLPPICDNGDMLVDGGYMDNLPVSVAKNMGADVIIAVDVASHDDTSPVYYGDSLSGWWALLQSLNPIWKPNYKIPSIADIQSRLAYVSSVAKLEEAKVTKGCIYMKLPVQKWATLEFDKFDDILKAGYDYGKDMIAKWKKEGLVPGRLNPVADGTMEAQGGLKGRIGRRNSI